MTATYPGAIDTVALLVQVGDGASPEGFSHPCLVNMNRSLQATAQATSQVVPRCDDPTAPGKTVRTVVSTDMTISGDGKLDRGAAKTYLDWLRSGSPKNIKVQAGSATGDLVVTGKFVLEEFTLTGTQHGELVTCAIKMSQADDPAASAHA